MIRAAVCLAGAGAVTATRDDAAGLPRTLVIGAALDQAMDWFFTSTKR